MDERISNLKGKKLKYGGKKINKEVETPKLPPPTKNKNNNQTKTVSQPNKQTESLQVRESNKDNTE